MLFVEILKTLMVVSCKGCVELKSCAMFVKNTNSPGGDKKIKYVNLLISTNGTQFNKRNINVWFVVR